MLRVCIPWAWDRAQLSTLGIKCPGNNTILYELASHPLGVHLVHKCGAVLVVQHHALCDSAPGNTAILLRCYVGDGIVGLSISVRCNGGNYRKMSVVRFPRTSIVSTEVFSPTKPRSLRTAIAVINLPALPDILSTQTTDWIDKWDERLVFLELKTMQTRNVGDELNYKRSSRSIYMEDSKG